MPHNLSKTELIAALREIQAVACARRSQYHVELLPLRGDVPAGQSADVIAMLRNGQCVALSSTFVQEIINTLGDRADHQPLPFRPVAARIAR